LPWALDPHEFLDAGADAIAACLRAKFVVFLAHNQNFIPTGCLILTISQIHLEVSTSLGLSSEPLSFL
jgi:hypothetical protein